jgi:hypothetical protein
MLVTSRSSGSTDANIPTCPSQRGTRHSPGSEQIAQIVGHIVNISLHIPVDPQHNNNVNNASDPQISHDSRQARRNPRDEDRIHRDSARDKDPYCLAATTLEYHEPRIIQRRHYETFITK